MSDCHICGGVTPCGGVARPHVVRDDLRKFVEFCEIEVPYWATMVGQEHRFEVYSRLLVRARSALGDL